jgi:hypothetical protein
MKGENMNGYSLKYCRKIAGAMFFMSLFIQYVTPSEPDLDVYIRVFKIPRVQNWEAKLSSGDGEITSIRVDGDLTAVFPDGAVFLQTDLSPLASESAIGQAIRDRVYFGNGGFKAGRISIEKLKKVQWRFDGSHSSEEVRFEKEISSYSKEDYSLLVILKSLEDDEIIMKIRFDAGRSSFGGGIGAGIIDTVFNRTVAFSENRILLVGFPSHDGGPRGTVYWLAVSAVRN